MFASCGSSIVSLEDDSPLQKSHFLCIQQLCLYITQFFFISLSSIFLFCSFSSSSFSIPFQPRLDFFSVLAYFSDPLHLSFSTAFHHHFLACLVFIFCSYCLLIWFITFSFFILYFIILLVNIYVFQTILISKLFKPLKTWSHGFVRHTQEFDCVCLTISWGCVLKI